MVKVNSEAERIVIEFLQALGHVNINGARKYCHSDISWNVKARGVPGAGLHRGCDAIFTFIGVVRELFAPGSPQIEIFNLVSAGPRVVMEAHGFGKLADGRDYDNHYAMAMELKDGLILAVREYMDSYYVNQLLGAIDPTSGETATAQH